MEYDLATLVAEQERRKGVVTGGTQSVLAPPEETTAFEEFKRFTESMFKGSAKGIIDLAGGWGSVYDALKKDKSEPSPLSGRGIVNAIANAGGPDLNEIQGYEGAHNFGQAAAPAAALTAAGLPGMFKPGILGSAGEFAVAGGTGVAAQATYPDSPLAQFAMQTSPYALMGVARGGRNWASKSEGTIPANAEELLTVGRLTPGELTGNRAQLGKETKATSSAAIGEKANVFRQAQAKEVEGFLNNVFKATTKLAGSAGETADKAFGAFKNYGKSLSGKLTSAAKVDFNAAKAAGGKVGTTPVLSVIEEKLASLPPEVAALDPMRNALQRIKNEFAIPGKEATSTPSAVLDSSGNPSSVTVTEAVPAKALEIDIDRLQKNLSAWGEAAYSGKADFGKGNIFEGVAPGQARGVAMDVLRGFRKSLDEAIDNGVPGADLLVKARDNFKLNLSHIEEFANRPLAKYFDVPTVSALTPEGVLEKLGKAKPSERIFLADVLRNSPDGAVIWDNVRRSQLDSILEKARKGAAGAAEGSPDINLKVLLTELNNRSGDFGYLLDRADLPKVNLALTWLKKVAKTESEGGANYRSDIYSSVRGVGATSATALALSEVGAMAKSMLSDPRIIADVVFTPGAAKKLIEAQKGGVPLKILNALKEVSKTAVRTTARSGPRLSTEQPNVQNEDTLADDNDLLNRLMAEQNRRTGAPQQ